MCLVESSTSTLPSTDNCDCEDLTSTEVASSKVFAFLNHRTRFLEDDLILLVLRYPQTFKLTKRAIKGEIISLSEQGDPGFSGSYMNQIHGNLGHFLLMNDEKEIEATGGLSYDDIKFIFQPVKCEQDTSNRASTVKLLMVRCQGMVDSGLEGCDYEIAMYFPCAFSIQQRSFLFGSISSVKKDIASDNPLFFNAITRTSPGVITEYSSYNYSKIKLLNVFERKTITYQILSIVKQSFFRYPAPKDAEEPLPQLSLLSNSVALHGYVVPDQLIDGQKSRVFIRLSFPLICGAKYLFKSKEPEAYGALPYSHPAYGMLKFLESFENVLWLVALLLTARLFQMVTES
ncbi:hypothetical protein REPUB_Repub18cG0086000 [Reevesia pubescens]